jgi:hypothetical protein
MNPNCSRATYQGDQAWFILDDNRRQRLPTNAIVYTLEEAETLADRTDWTRRIVHEAKKRGAKSAHRPSSLRVERGIAGNTAT